MHFASLSDTNGDTSAVSIYNRSNRFQSIITANHAFTPFERVTANGSEWSEKHFGQALVPTEIHNNSNITSYYSTSSATVIETTQKQCIPKTN